MQIERIFYPVLTLGYGKRIGIWTIGCPHACFNCSNPELWASKPEKDIPITDLYRMIAGIRDNIDGVTITGGEPFNQTVELYGLITFLKNNITDDILIFSGYTLEELCQRDDLSTHKILKEIAVLIDGKYVEKLNDNLAMRGSSNQRIHILNEKYRSRYESLIKEVRKVQTVYFAQNLLTIGIPMKHYKRELDGGFQDWGINVDK